MYGEQGMSTTLFVGNLSWDTTNESLQAFMTAGGVNWMSAEVQSHADSGRSKGWGLASFATPEDAQTAMQVLNDRELDGRPVNLREDRGPTEKTPRAPTEGGKKKRNKKKSVGGGDDPSKLFIGNLAWTVTSESLYGLFASSGAQSAEVQFKPNGTSKGFALAQFLSPEAANQAVESFSGYELEGRPMQVRVDGKGDGGGERKPREQTGTVDPNRLFIGNLAWTVTSETLFPLFSSMGAQSVIVQMKPNGTSKGFALAQMNSPEAANQAIESFNGFDLEGRPMSVKFDSKGY